MIPRIAFAVLTGAFLAGGGALAACPQEQHAKAHPPKTAKERAQVASCVDLGVVPQISANIAAGGPQAPIARASTSDATAKYEGPTIGLTKPEPGVRPAPTVGYKWSLD
jgi:hypothetical protein